MFLDLGLVGATTTRDAMFTQIIASLLIMDEVDASGWTPEVDATLMLQWAKDMREDILGRKSELLAILRTQGELVMNTHSGWAFQHIKNPIFRGDRGYALREYFLREYPRTLNDRLYLFDKAGWVKHMEDRDFTLSYDDTTWVFTLDEVDTVFVSNTESLVPIFLRFNAPELSP
jgi:hypothetical protein